MDLIGRGRRSHLGQSHCQDSIVKVRIATGLVSVGRKANGSLDGAIASFDSMLSGIVDLVFLLAMTFDHKVVVLHRDVQVFLIHAWEICVHLELSLGLHKIEIENWFHVGGQSNDRRGTVVAVLLAGVVLLKRAKEVVVEQRKKRHCCFCCCLSVGSCCLVSVSWVGLDAVVFKSEEELPCSKKVRLDLPEVSRWDLEFEEETRAHTAPAAVDCEPLVGGCSRRCV